MAGGAAVFGPCKLFWGDFEEEEEEEAPPTPETIEEGSESTFSEFVFISFCEFKRFSVGDETFKIFFRKRNSEYSFEK